jgi:peptidoglycan-associated lipoprotein
MKRRTAGFFLAVSCGAILAGGCAKNEVIKKDQPMAPSANVVPAKVQPKQEQAKASAVEQAPVSKEVVKESDAPVAAVTGTDQAAELRKGLQTIYFNFDSATLSEQARNTLAKDADLLKNIGKAKIRVEGNCDERGSDDYNLALGEKRAKEAVQYLANLGIPTEQLTVISYGKEKPVATGHDEASWAKNRRDDFVVLP